MTDAATALLRTLAASLRWPDGQPLPLSTPVPEVPRPKQPLQDAAVLVPILRTRGGYDVVLTRRTDHLSAHAGQMSFPGGRRDPGDASLLDTALRETAEEIGVAPAEVAVLGRLNRLYTPSGYDIQPFVGVLAESTRFAADPREVAAIMRVPLRHLVDRRNYLRRIRRFESRDIEYVAVDYDDQEIWGATARILVDLVDQLEQCEASRCLLVSFLAD
ncbi:MAG: CoA pyrophosphatase [Gammaproteobacteria bacterium]|nr:CoA pyrophosphatase [Gammaproteobacteria bacterium]